MRTISHMRSWSSKCFFFLGEQPRCPASIAVTNLLAPSAPLKDRGLSKNLFPFSKVEDRIPDQLVKGQSE